MSLLRFFLLFLLLPNILVAQMLDTKKGDPLSDEPFFDDEFIKWQKINGLKGFIIYMLADGTIVNTNYNVGYKFDKEGRLIQQYETIQDDGSKDTTWNFYTYDEHSRIVEHQKCFGKKCSSYLEEYDTNGFIQIQQELHMDDTGKSELIYRDSITTYYNDSLVIQKYFNNSGAYFCTEETQLDYMKRPLSKLKRYFYSTDLWNETNIYNSEGKLWEKNTFEGTNSIPVKKSTYTYDSEGSLIKQELFKNGALYNEKEFLYNKNHILESIISQDYETGKVTIIRFSELRFN